MHLCYFRRLREFDHRFQRPHCPALARLTRLWQHYRGEHFKDLTLEHDASTHGQYPLRICI